VFWTAYVCDNKAVDIAMCFVLSKNAVLILWSLDLIADLEHQCKGGVITPDRLYVTLQERQLVTLDDK
jgi:hypothetical protein